MLAAVNRRSKKTKSGRIAASVARYPAGGPDPLEPAWPAYQRNVHPSNRAQFLAIAAIFRVHGDSQSLCP